MGFVQVALPDFKIELYFMLPQFCNNATMYLPKHNATALCSCNVIPGKDHWFKKAADKNSFSNQKFPPP